MHHQVPHNNGITPVMQAPIPLTQGVNVDVSPLSKIGWNNFWRMIYILMLLNYSWIIYIMRACIDGRNRLETDHFSVKWAKLPGLYLPHIQLILLHRPLGFQVVSDVLSRVSGGFPGVSRSFIGIFRCDITTGYQTLIKATHPIYDFMNFQYCFLNYRTKVVRLWLLQVDHHIFFVIG